MPSFPGQVWIEEEAAPATLLCRAREGFSAPFELRLCWALNRNLQPPLTVTMATIARMSRTRVAQIAQSRAISTTAARAAAINFTPLVGKVANDADKVRLPPSPATGLAVFIFDELLKIPIHFLGWNSMSFQRSYNLVVSK